MFAFYAELFALPKYLQREDPCGDELIKASPPCEGLGICKKCAAAMQPPLGWGGTTSLQNREWRRVQNRADAGGGHLDLGCR